MSTQNAPDASPLDPQTVFPALEPGDAILTPGLVSVIEECYMGRVPAFLHMMDLCRLLEILVSHNRVFVPRTSNCWLATDLGGTLSIFDHLAEVGVVKYFYPCSRILGPIYRDGLGSPESLWAPRGSSDLEESPSPGTHANRSGISAERQLFALCGAADLASSEWDEAYFPLAQAALTTATNDKIAFQVWGNAFHMKGRSLYEGPKLCFNQGYIAAMPPDELESRLSSGLIRKDASGRIIYGNITFTPPQACIAEIMHYWRFLDEARRISSRRGAVLYHALMETPFVQLKETEFDKVDGSTAREAIYANASVSDDFKTVYGRWVAEYRTRCFGRESIGVPPLAQLVFSNTSFRREEVVYEFRDSHCHEFRAAMFDRKLHSLQDGVLTTRKRLQAFRKINTESLASIAELRSDGRADLKKYAQAKDRFIAALKKSGEGTESVRKIFSFSSGVEFLGQTLLGNWPKMLLDLAKKLAELLPLSNELHFGSANTLYDIANVLEDPVRSFRDVFGELSAQAKDDLPHFLG